MITETNIIDIRKSEQLRGPDFDFDTIQFGKDFSDHMFSAEYKNGQWGELQIIPFADLQMSPAAGGIHYGQSIFEGMKAYKSDDGQVVLFRPEENLRRLNVSAVRLCMPELPEDIFIEGLKKLMDLDRVWVPAKEGYSLYIRPFMFASEAFLGVKPSSEYRFIIITSPVGSYYTNPVKLKIETHFTRAAEGGVGYAKAAGNYSTSLYPAQLAAEEGYNQLLWTDAKEHKYFEEAGTMNIMFQIGNSLITPSLESKTILPGITRKSVLEVAKKWGYQVEERKVSVVEIVEALQKGLLLDAFGTGTAANIATVSSIGHEGIDYELPPVEERELSNKMKAYLDDLKKGRVDDEFNWTVRV